MTMTMVMDDASDFFRRDFYLEDEFKAEDFYLTILHEGREGLLQLLESRKVQVVTFSDWEKIDSKEKRLGSLKGKPREKLTTWKDLLEVTTKTSVGYIPCSSDGA